jgi:citrate synthase
MADIALNHAGGTLSLKVTPSTDGPDGVGIGSLLKETGHVTLDPGFVNTASCTSAITYIDGENGILRYRGYPIEELAERSSFLEVAYLLIYGELPTAAQLTQFTNGVRHHTLLDENFKAFFNGFPRDAHPMAVLSSAVSALSTFYPGSLDPFDPEQVDLSSLRLIAKLPTIAAYAYKTAIGHPLLYPDNSLSYVENFLRMTFGMPTEPYEVDPEIVRILDMLFILHADHEQNCSTSTVRLVGSSHANLFSSVSAGVDALLGPLHGGANQAVLEMLEGIHERKLYPNVDFYTGVIYKALGFPTNAFTVLFAIGRLPGWIAQWREMMTDPDTKIGRPRQVYVGPKERHYAPLDERDDG